VRPTGVASETLPLLVIAVVQPDLISLTRIDLESSRLQAMILEAGLELQVLSELQLQQSIDEILQLCFNSDVWIFAYGSLIWNPIIKYSDRYIFGTVYGWHRRFCHWTPLGRGTPENLGLVLGLDRGGSCRGIIYRVAASDVTTELLLLFAISHKYAIAYCHC
jgi:glutathione-specific gamma-glutamylcyclotransferase